MLQPLPSIRLDRRADAAVRYLRTLLDEARTLTRNAEPGGPAALLDHRIAHAQQEARRLAPDFSDNLLQNGEGEG
ncbi:MAG TPA: hypothetical protein VE567_08125 [Sphingomonas sp.]|nr:hypothetical protein [Sphingomonas sp.]